MHVDTTAACASQNQFESVLAMVIACFKVVSSSPSGTRAIRILVVVVARHAREGVAWTAEGHRDVCGAGARRRSLRVLA